MTFATLNETELAMRAVFWLVDLKSIVGALRHPCAVLDAHARIIAASHAFCAFLGSTLDQVLGRTLGASGGDWLTPPRVAEVLGRLDTVGPEGWDEAITLEPPGGPPLRINLSIHEILPQRGASRLFVFSIENVIPVQRETECAAADRNPMTPSTLHLARLARETQRELRNYLLELVQWPRSDDDNAQVVDQGHRAVRRDTLAKSSLGFAYQCLKTSHSAAASSAGPGHKVIPPPPVAEGEGIGAQIANGTPGDSPQPTAPRDSDASYQAMKRLSPRERLIVERVVSGQSNKEIALLLSISPRTVEHHRAAAMLKVGARTVCDLVRMWTTSGFGETGRTPGRGQTAS